MIWYLDSKLDMRQERPEPEFNGNLVYKLKKIVGANNFQRSSLK